MKCVFYVARPASLWAALVLLTMQTACQREAGIEYVTQSVAKGAVRDSVMATGIISARIKVNVGSQLSGTVEKVYVDFNAPVKKGQVLAALNDRLVAAQLARSEAAVAVAEANIENARVTLADAERTLRRSTALKSDNLVAQADLDQAELARDGARAGLKSTEASLKQAQADLKQNTANLSFTKILSPIDGVVIDRQVEEGQTVAAQLQVATLFVIANDMRHVRVLADIDEADIGKIAEGMRVDFGVDAYPGKLFTGTIRTLRQVPTSAAGSTSSGTTSSSSSSTSGVVTYAADIDAENPEHKLRQGMTAHVSVVVGEKKDVLLVPNAALRFAPKPGTQAAGADAPKPTGSDPRKPAAPNGGHAYLLRSGKPVRVPVVLGLSNGHVVEVVEGLSEGTVVITGEVPKPKARRVF